MILERALIVRKPWIDLILSGQKTWEMRSRPTNVRGEIGLIEAGSGLVVGSVNVVDSAMFRLTKHGFYETLDKHRLCNYDDTKWKYWWELKNPKHFEMPIPYQHPRGAVVWVNIKNLEIEV